jgi:hypothetical protein
LLVKISLNPIKRFDFLTAAGTPHYDPLFSQLREIKRV